MVRGVRVSVKIAFGDIRSHAPERWVISNRVIVCSTARVALVAVEPNEGAISVTATRFLADSGLAFRFPELTPPPPVRPHDDPPAPDRSSSPSSTLSHPSSFPPHTYPRAC